MAGEREVEMEMEVCSFFLFYLFFIFLFFWGVVLGMGTVNRAQVLFVIIGY